MNVAPRLADVVSWIRFVLARHLQGKNQMKVKLMYFEPGTGKFCGDGELDVGYDWSIQEVWNVVERRMESFKLPGLVEGYSDYLVLVTVPGHPHDHPRLFDPEWL